MTRNFSHDNNMEAQASVTAIISGPKLGSLGSVPLYLKTLFPDWKKSRTSMVECFPAT